MPRSVVIVGAGMATVGLISELALQDISDLEITIVDKEPFLPCNKALFHSVISGKRSELDLSFYSQQWYLSQKISLRLGSEVTFVDRRNRTIHLADGDTIAFDYLVLATGSTPSVPEFSDDAAPSIVIPRTKRDLLQLEDLLESKSKAVVVGGGPFGIEISLSITNRGVPVELIHSGPHLLDKVIDSAPAQIVRERLESLGVKVTLSKQVTSISAQNDLNLPRGELWEIQKPLRLSLGDATEAYGDFVVIAAGSSPNVVLAHQMGLEISRGIVVDHHLRSSDSAVFAIGGCSEYGGALSLGFDSAWEQGVALAKILLNNQARYQPKPSVTRISSNQMMLAIYSDTGTADSRGTESIELLNNVKKSFKQIRISKGRLVGAVLIGDDDAAGSLASAIGAPEAPMDLQEIFFGDAAAPLIAHSVLATDLICACNRVTKGHIDEVLGSCASNQSIDELFYSVVSATQATTGCGSCQEMVASLVRLSSSIEQSSEGCIDTRELIGVSG